MDKRVTVGVIILLIVVGGAFLLLKSRAPFVDTTSVVHEEDEFKAFDIDVAAFTQDEAILSELDQTLDDVVEGGEVSTIESIDSVSISQEANHADFSNDLTGFANDGAALQELDQVFGEVLQ